MNCDPVLFASPMLETANEAFLFCKDLLLEKNDPAAQHLEGLDPINTASLGRLALKALYTVRSVVRGESREYVDIAINSMERAVGERPLNAVA